MAEETKTKAIQVSFPLIFVRTTRGLGLMDKVGSFRPTKAYGFFLLYVLPLIAVVGFFFIVLGVSNFLQNAAAREAARSTGPAVYLLIPGVNPLVPAIYGWAGIFIGILVHEGGHGIVARALKVPVKSSGLILLLGLPIGAFVEIDDKELMKMRFRDSGRILAAGPGTNLLIAVLSILAIILTVSSLTPVGSGVGVISTVEATPAQLADLRTKDIIMAANGTRFQSYQEFFRFMSSTKPRDVITFQILRNGETLPKTLTLAVNPQNSSRGFMGVQLIDAAEFHRSFMDNRVLNPLTYLLPPVVPAAQIPPSGLPYSETLKDFYTSPIDKNFYPLANLLYWVWFINFNLGVFNALPIYPLDGGIALRAVIKATFKERISDKGLKTITAAVTLSMVALIAFMIVAPYLIF